MGLNLYTTEQLKSELDWRSARDSAIKVWKNTVLKNYMLKNKVSESDVNQILNFFSSKECNLNLARLSFPDAKIKTKLWQKKIAQKEKNLMDSGLVGTVMEFESGFTMVRLLDQTALEWEGKQMGHCAGDYLASDSEIYSLRDSNYIPHCTILLNGEESACGQISGKGNSVPAKAYDSMILSFLKKMKIEYFECDSLFWSQFHRVTPALKKQLDYHFSNLEYINFDSELYLKNVKKSIKLVNPITKKSSKLFDFLICTNLSQLAIKQMLDQNFIRDLNKNEEYLALAVRSLNLDMVKFLISLGCATDFSIIEEMLCCDDERYNHIYSYLKPLIPERKQSAEKFAKGIENKKNRKWTSD